MSEVETVLCVERAKMRPVDGYVPVASGAEVMTALEMPFDAPGLWVDRKRCEGMPELKQVIPYVLLRHEGLVAVFRRTSRGSETKLHRRLTVGVGGHVDYLKDLADPNYSERPWDAIRHSIYREINEEVGPCEVIELVLKGLVNVEENAGIYHVGLVYDATVSGNKLGGGDGHLQFVGWEPPYFLWSANVHGRFEEWTEAVINGRFKPLSGGGRG